MHGKIQNCGVVSTQVVRTNDFARTQYRFPFANMSCFQRPVSCVQVGLLRLPSALGSFEGVAASDDFIKEEWSRYLWALQGL